MSEAWIPFQPAIEDRDVLLLPARVGKTKVDELDLVVFDQLGDVGRTCHLSSPDRVC
jgi:hypothetical protein